MMESALIVGCPVRVNKKGEVQHYPSLYLTYLIFRSGSNSLDPIVLISCKIFGQHI